MPDTTLQLVAHAGLFVKVILTLLASFSIISWAVIFYKYYYFSAAARESAVFLAAVDASEEGITDLLKTAKTLSVSPLACLFVSAYPHHTRGSRDAVSSAWRRYETQEMEKLQSYLTFLATTGATAPFIGLLGTVWGIMNAFRGIGATGSASLAVVAPGIAEALITTAAGLAAAIPAVMAYNYFLNGVRRMTIELEDFSMQLHELFAKRTV